MVEVVWGGETGWGMSGERGRPWKKYLSVASIRACDVEIRRVVMGLLGCARSQNCSFVWNVAGSLLPE